MNFLAQVEENLRDLGSEARKKHPGVKEASERAILTLRSLQSQYVSAVRASTSSKNGSSPIPHPTTALFRSQDVLRPFLLACNYPDASSALLFIGLKAIQLLISGDAVCPEDSVHIARVLGIQAACCCRHFQNESSSSQQSRGPGGVMASIIGAGLSIPSAYYSSSGLSGIGHRSVKDDETISLKVLQTLTIMIGSKELELSEEVLSQAVMVCLTLVSGNEGLKDDKNKKKNQRGNNASERDGSGGNTLTSGGNDNLRRAAAATLKQVLLFTFDRAVGTEDLMDNKLHFLKMTRSAAAHAFADLCVLCENRIKDSKGRLSRIEVTGPFAIQGTNGSKSRTVKPPPQSACFEMLNMVINHKPDLFVGRDEEKELHSCNQHESDMKESFESLLRDKACSVLSLFFMSELNFEKENSLLNPAAGNDENMKDEFSLIIRSTRLACTIINRFGKCTQFRNECQVLLKALSGFVSLSADAFRDTDEFEDGYIYSKPQQISQTSEAQTTNLWRNASDSFPFLIPNLLLWRSALALECIYFVAQDSEMLKHLHNSDKIDEEGPQLVGLIAESVADFATTAASNKFGILSVVRTVSYRQHLKLESTEEYDNSLQPQIFARACTINKLFDDWESLQKGQKSTVFHQDDFTVDVSSFDKSEIPYCDDGEAIWVAFNCILSLASSLRDLSVENLPETKSLIECSFAPMMAVLQHFLKRFPYESHIREKALKGFKDLVDVCLPLGSEDGLHSEALIKCLCGLSLPSWGKVESNCQLQNQHIETISTIFDVIHNHHEQLSSNWNVILATLEQLSSLSISSPHLSSSGYQHATEISNMFNRIANFTKFLSLKALHFFIAALVDLSKSVPIAMNELDPESISSETSEPRMQSGISPQTNGEDLQVPSSTLGGKLMSLAGRAFTNQHLPQQETKDEISEHRVHSSKVYAGDFLNSAFSHLAITKPTTKKEIFCTLPYSLVLLSDVALINSFRFRSCGKPITDHLCELASTSPIANIRAYAIDTLASLFTSQLSANYIESQADPSLKPVTLEEKSFNNYLVLHDEERVLIDEDGFELMSQSELLSPLCQTIADTPARDAAEAGLNSLYIILESSGHDLSSDAWPILISSISALSGAGTKRSSQAWANCGTLAFRCLKLIVDDFLDDLPKHPSSDANATRNALLHCCACFGKSQFDVNTSLTATGMLWTIADQDSTPSALDDVLAKLAYLACDERAEVRNCSVNTLFSCVVGLGYRFTSNQWRNCLEGTIFGVLDQVSIKMGNSHGNEIHEKSTPLTSPRYRVSVHHSRDSYSKQWCATQVLNLRGIERVLRQFFEKLLNLGINSNNGTSWFEKTWEQIIKFAFISARASGGRETMELRIAGVDILVLCCQLSCEAGISAAATPVRVGTNMQVVNGALRSVQRKPLKQPQNENVKPSASSGVNENHTKLARNRFFLKSFDSLERITNVLHQIEEEEEETSYFSEPSILQVLTKLSFGLTKLYDCCKDKELAPSLIVQYTTFSNVHITDLEGRMVNMINSVAIHAFGGVNSKYLTQAQRTCLDLLRKMCGKGSARAFERLALMGGKSFFCRKFISMNENKNEIDENDLAFEHLEFEAAKNASDAFVKEGVYRVSKVVVLCMILKTFLEHKSVERLETSKDKNEVDGIDSYALLIYVVQGGLEAASLVEKDIFDSKEATIENEEEISVNNEKNVILLEELWDRIVCMLSSIFSQTGCDHNVKFIGLTDEILEILSSCIKHVPERSNVHLGEALSKGANFAISVAKIERGVDQVFDESCRDCLRVFEACFGGLSKCDPRSSNLLDIAKNSLMDILASSLPKEIDMRKSTLVEDEQRSVDGNLKAVVAIEVGIIVCEVLRAGSMNLTDLIIVIFPWLCKLTNLDEERIRKKAGLVLGSVDLARVIAGKIEQTREAELYAEKTRAQHDKMSAEVKKLKVENDSLRLEIMRLSK